MRRLKQIIITLTATTLALVPAFQTGATGSYSLNEYAVPTAGASPFFITPGPDGALWFTEAAANKIGRITPQGAVTEYPVPTPDAGLAGITAGPDGALWFTEQQVNKIGRITTDGTVTEYNLPTPNSLPFGITAGPDGNVWFTEFGSRNIGRITPAGVITEFFNGPQPNWIAAGPDGALWVTENISSTISRYDVTGTKTATYPTTQFATPTRITAGPDGALWFTEAFSSGNPLAGNKIGRITTDGVVTEYPTGLSGGWPQAITTGTDGALWFTWNGTGGKVGRMATDGTVSNYFDISSSVSGITAGLDGSIWFTEQSANRIGKLSSVAVAANLAITPGEGVNTIGEQAQFTVTATDIVNNPVANVQVKFQTEGSVSATGECTTNASGECIFTYDSPTLPGADAINAYVDLNANNQQDEGEPATSAAQAWLTPNSTPGSVTGGGHIQNAQGDSVAFGFSAKSLPGGVTGNCEVIDRAGDVKLHCLTTTALVANGDTAIIFGLADLNGTTVIYRVDVQDNGEPGAGSDVFTLVTSNGYSVGGTLIKGNIQVH